MRKEPPKGTFLMVFHETRYYLIWNEVAGWSCSGQDMIYTWDQLVYWFGSRLDTATELVIKREPIS